MPERAFTYHELVWARECQHALARLDCPSCIRRLFWREGRRDGIREVSDLTSHLASESWRETIAKEALSV